MTQHDRNMGDMRPVIRQLDEAAINRIAAGEVVLSGSFIRPIEARHGDTISADFGPYGSVSLYFE